MARDSTDIYSCHSKTRSSNYEKSSKEFMCKTLGIVKGTLNRSKLVLYCVIGLTRTTKGRTIFLCKYYIKPFIYSQKSTLKSCWRRRRDSNPRRHCCLNGFQDHRIRPLCHFSTKTKSIIPRILFLAMFFCVNFLRV